MIRHTDLGLTPYARLKTLTTMIKSRAISLGGHRPGKIYGRLNCRTGKRMKPENRVFFQNEAKAIEQGYRPCAVCLPEEYRVWKKNDE